MISYKRQDVTHEQYVISEAICDRCDRKLPRITGIGPETFSFKGTEIAGRIFPKSGNANDVLHFDAEICDRCTEDLISWLSVGKGRGGRLQNAIERSNALAYKLAAAREEVPQ